MTSRIGLLAGNMRGQANRTLLPGAMVDGSHIAVMKEVRGAPSGNLYTTGQLVPAADVHSDTLVLVFDR
jgi:hypothetical protein